MTEKPAAQITVLTVVLCKAKKQTFSFHQHNSTRNFESQLSLSHTCRP